MVGAGGQLLERSIVDRMVSAPERLAFEGKPILEHPLAQDEAGRDFRDKVAKTAGVGKHVIDQRLKRAAERQDPRPQIEAPTRDEPWLPQMNLLNEVLGSSKAPEPPMRDIEGFLTEIHTRALHSMHMLSAAGINESDTTTTRLPAPDLPLLTRLNDVQVAELIERHIDYFDAGTDRSVHLNPGFVKHFVNRLDKAMGFLTDEWLADVATDYTGKAVIIAMALTILERLTLPERPAFFITAG